MWVDEAEELFKGYFPYYLLIVLPVFILIMPANPVAASHEFPVFRMQHYDLHGISHGCRSAGVNLEARSLMGWSTSRHCVIARIQDLTADHFRSVRSKAGALIIVLPVDMSQLSDDEKQHVTALEDVMLAQDTSLPVYFVRWTPEIERVLAEISHSFAADDKTKSAAEALLNSIAANGYQVVVGAAAPGPKQDIRVASVQGSLAGLAGDGRAPTIVVVAHYDAFGVAPDLSFGADSNGSGVAVLMELVRLFSKLYANPKTQGRFNIVFLLSGAGKMNYQGSKKWLEDQLDSVDGSFITDATYVMCLDTLASTDSLYMHVSKPPKENSPASLFFKELRSVGQRSANVSVEGVHKKINLAEDLLAWEHERFSIRRLSAFTLSSLRSHKDLSRGTIVDAASAVRCELVERNARVIAETLASYVYDLPGGEIFGGSLKVERSHLEVWIKYLGGQARAAQLLCAKDNPLVGTFKEIFNRFLKDVRVSYVTPDKREPDFMFYDATKGALNIYSVKPAVFDLILTIVIVMYLGGIYLVVQKFSKVYDTACRIAPAPARKSLKTH